MVVGAGLTIAATVPAGALSPSIDADQDGWIDGLETLLGSDPGDAAKTPESVANPPACTDGTDNDGDGATDVADSGCTVPPAVDGTFPPAGMDVFDSHMTLDGYALAIGPATCSVDFDAHGPAVVQRGAPVDLEGGLREIAVEMLAMQLSGTATINPGAGCPLPAGDVAVTVIEDPAQASVGKVTDTNSDPASDFPADSFFDVFFEIDVNGALIPGGPPGGPAGLPVRVTNQIGALPPYHTAKSPNCYMVQGLTHEHCPKAPPNHFKCYAARFPKFEKRTVTLRDQFGQAEARVLKPLFLCTPTTKGAEPLYDEASHLTCYALKPKKAKQIVVVHNQFGTGDVTTKKRTMLCLPTEKNGEGDAIELDHFACYSGKFPKIAPRPVALVDQFRTEENEASRAFMLCNPVSKNGGPIRNPLEHFVFYRLKPQRESRTVTIENQFGQAQVQIRKSALLGVPTGKFEQDGTTTTTIEGTTTTTTTIPTGRALDPIQPFPGVPAGPVCLADVIPAPDGCVQGPDQCPNVHVHLTIAIRVGTQTVGPFTDTFVNPCGHGSVIMQPGCPPDDMPACS
jgi:hypothetical protein